MKMKKKIIDIIVDILLIMVVFAITDALVLNVFHPEKMWQELLLYIANYAVFYGIVFGSKHGLTVLWKRAASEKKESEEEK